jgi:hypothetical protein
MKIIRTFDDWCNNALALLKNSKYCYIASFNLNYRIDDKVHQIINRAADVNHQILIGLSTMACKQNCESCIINNQVKYDNVKRLGDLTGNYKIAQALHMKAFITSNGVIVGGMNITGSGWIDRSFVSKDKTLIKELITDFKEVYSTSEDYIIPQYVDTSKIFTFGKYKGQLIEDVRKKNPGYIEWLNNTSSHTI